MAKHSYNIERVASPSCDKCKSTNVFCIDGNIECYDCNKPTANSTTKQLKLERCDKIYRIKQGE